MGVELQPIGYLPWQTHILENACTLKAQERLPHAVLLENPSRQDLSGFIQHLAMLLLCDAPRGIDFCGECKACDMMLAKTYSDYNCITQEPDAKTKKLSKNIKIEQVRNLIHQVNLTRNHNRLKIATIYPAEKMSIAGANSLLKTLEEPADHVFFLLVTHNKGRIPITIRSRCQSWPMNAAGDDQARQWLSTQQLDVKDIDLYMGYSGGDPVLAYNLQQQDYAAMVADFKKQFGQYLRNQASVSELSSSISSLELSSVQRLIEMILKAYSFQYCGLDVNGKTSNNAEKRKAAQATLELQQKAQKQLQIDENNLDLKLQLEDVLISLKRIITRGMN